MVGHLGRCVSYFWSIKKKKILFLFHGSFKPFIISLSSVRLTARWQKTCHSATQGSWSRSLAGSCSWWCRETNARCWSESPPWSTATRSSMVRDTPNWKAAGPIQSKGKPGASIIYKPTALWTSYDSTVETLLLLLFLLLLYLSIKLVFPS